MKFIKLLLTPVIFFSFFAVFAQNIHAVTITINNYPSTISDSPFNLEVSMTGASTGNNYFRMALYKDGTQNYFGETYNGSDWYNGSDGVQYFKIDVVSGQTANASFQAKLGNPSVGEFTGPGNYKLKIRRYTNSGAESGNDTQVSVDVNITYTSPTPTPSPSPVPTATNTPTLTPTGTLTPTPSEALTPTPKPTNTPTPKGSPTPAFGQDESDTDKSVLSFSDTFGEGEAGPTPIVYGDTVTLGEGKRFPWTAGVFIMSGAALVGYAIYTLLRNKKSGYNSNHVDEESQDKLS